MLSEESVSLQAVTGGFFEHRGEEGGKEGVAAEIFTSFVAFI